MLSYYRNDLIKTHSMCKNGLSCDLRENSKPHLTAISNPFLAWFSGPPAVLSEAFCAACSFSCRILVCVHTRMHVWLCMLICLFIYLHIYQFIFDYICFMSRPCLDVCATTRYIMYVLFYLCECRIEKTRKHTEQVLALSHCGPPNLNLIKVEHGDKLPICFGGQMCGMSYEFDWVGWRMLKGTS